MKNNISGRRRLVLGAALAVAAGAAGVLPVQAADYPTRAVRLVVPIGPGSGADTVMRYLAERLAPALGQAVVVDNKPGAETLLATQAVLGAPADGYNLLLTAVSTLTVPFTNSAAKYDPVRDLRPIAVVSRGPALLVTASQSRFATFAQALAEARRKSGAVSMAVYSNSYRVGVLDLSRQGGPAFNLISYKGFSQLSADVIGGSVDLALVDASAALPLIRSGKLRALATTGETRMAEIPAMPTVRESGFPGYSLYVWIGLAVRSGTPEPVVRRLEKEVGAIVTSPAYRDFIAKQNPGAEPVGLVGAPAAQDFVREAERYRNVLGMIGQQPGQN
ncbi:tripartite tricarboxylate transporter substrate binding protein [Cupriavidus numazuensis]|uniref:Extra-cytoplasmic solute receptor n=1 Tax=Cupriavidus numazuensis TaxID=221992 RepID=A0ABN7Q7W1_9BURK|nr:tripartite tricarboxylate transporter substrate binding protein [Cupriavidus numazuensis]CAG2159322.1 hypothetical protein LMG26411_06614 [Cupriavidus numazuensis]